MISRVFPTSHALSARDFQESAFVPFSHYVDRAKGQRAARQHADALARRRTDFTDAVLVRDVSNDVPPEFADTIPMAPDDADVSVIEPEFVDVNIPDREGRELMQRALNVVAATAFQQCLWQGYFPPRCQRCSR